MSVAPTHITAACTFSPKASYSAFPPAAASWTPPSANPGLISWEDFIPTSCFSFFMSHSLLTMSGYRLVQPLFKAVWEALHQLRIDLLRMLPSFPTSENTSKWSKVCNLQLCICDGTVHNSEEIETTQMPIQMIGWRNCRTSSLWNSIISNKLVPMTDHYA